MRKLLGLFVMLTVVVGGVWAQPPEVLWTTYFYSPSEYLIYDLHHLPDQYVVGCGGVAYDEQATDMLLFLMDPAGNVVWSHTWLRLGSGIRVFDMGGTGFLVAGRFSLDSTASFWIGDETAYGLMRTDANGDSLWTRVYGGPRNRYLLTDALMLPDGGLFLTGSHEHLEYPFDSARPFSVRLNGDFDTLWTRANESGYSLFPVRAAGTSDIVTTFIAPSELPTVTGMTLDGDSLWTHTFPWPSAGDLGQVVVRELGDGYKICGSPMRSGRNEIYIADLDHAGDTLSVQAFSYSQDSTAEFTPVDFNGLPDDGNIVLGFMKLGNNPNWYYESLLVRVNAEADTLWTFRASMPPYAIPFPTCVILTDDHGYLFTRPVFLPSHGVWTTEIVRLGPDPTLAAEDPPFIVHRSSLIAYPNPFNATTMITFSLPQAGKVELKVYDVTGRLAKTLADEVMSAGEHRLTVDGTDLASGVYLARLTTPDQASTQKLLLLK